MTDSQSPYQPYQAPESDRTDQSNTPTTGWIRVFVQGGAFAHTRAKKIIRFHGEGMAFEVPADFGENRHPVPPGRWRVEVHCLGLIREFGRAECDLDVTAGQTARCYYAAPMDGLSRGRVGPHEQTHPGRLGYALLCVCIVAVIVWGISLRAGA